MGLLQRICYGIDRITDIQGKIACLIALPMVVSLVYEVFARYMFNAPTKWSYDVTYMIYGSHYLLGAGFALLYKVHIRIDVIYNLFPQKIRQVIDVIGYIFFFFPVVIILVLSAISMASDAYNSGEVSQFSPWAPILWPFKSIMAIAFIFLFLQGIAEFLRAATILIKGESRGEN
ncbi:MAG: TRAP transporter small permease subunit [Desulfobacteraceae bacterium]|nr:MAG: TRAP transporter small permease subunit [Desulfobacteraceae bacterium]